MKLVSMASFVVALLLSLLLPVAGLLLPVFFGAAFGAYGIAVSFARHLDPLNDVPNALRVFLASLGGFFVTLTGAFVFPSVGVLLLAAALYLNDEFQRRALHALVTGTKGGSVALLGIDGSGKSSHSTVTGKWLRERGYLCAVMPFHRYLFVERLASISSAAGGKGGGGGGDRFRFKRGGNPLRPVASLLDNLVLQLLSSVGCRLEGKVVIYDRFIWSTYVKYRALGYPVRPISGLYLSPRPTFALVLNVPVEKSLQVIDERVAHIHYPREVLESERQQYLEIARRGGYPVIDATAPFEEVQEKIESHLSLFFPPVGRGAKAS
jgi:thymidylate kinase